MRERVSIGGKIVTNLRFADNIDALAEERQDLDALLKNLGKICTRYKMEISAQKTKLMTNNANGIQREIKVKEQKLSTVTSFKYLEAIASDDGFQPEDCTNHCSSNKAEAHVERYQHISWIKGKADALVISTFLYACESCILTAGFEKRTGF